MMKFRDILSCFIWTVFTSYYCTKNLNTTRPCFHEVRKIITQSECNFFSLPSLRENSDVLIEGSMRKDQNSRAPPPWRKDKHGDFFFRGSHPHGFTVFAGDKAAAPYRPHPRFWHLKKKKKKKKCCFVVGCCCFVAENPRGEGPSFNIEVQLKALICACKLVTNNSNNVVFRRMCKIINVN